VASLRGTIMVIGASDTGKSTLARYLFQELCRAGLRVAYLDGDVGQSTLGLPTTMTVALSSRTGDEQFTPTGRGPAISSARPHPAGTCYRWWLVLSFAAESAVSGR